MSDSPALHEVAAGIHAWVQPDGSWWLNNAGVIHGGSSVVLVDTCATRRRTSRFLEAVAAATNGAHIDIAVNTHLHGDHTYGNALLPPTTTIVSHKLTRAGLLADFILKNTPPVWSPAPEWEISEIRAATVTFDSSMTVHAGDVAVSLEHPGYSAHTPGDAIAWVPSAKVLFTGDLIFHKVTPLVFMGSVSGALRSLEWLRGFEADHVVPGHGPLIDGSQFGEVLDTHVRYYKMVQATAAAGLDRGWTPLDAAKDCDLGEFAGLPDAERVVLNLHRAYAEATNTEMDLLASMTDAMTYNGGPLACAL
ncbi:MBL fold metallo-hydrolase [Kibdelosporangium phytohabitans]|uniref:MBL fold metallo-hydrolase n=1 Tax=Kibdelosporangium phytohabitans TaxID=860235 RepID=A0A0N9IB92_9PSEU|nr:MBL fold metallo-hydrolase [Kibdelosporangium phytohabitans]ALG13440.1 MBL fold metallo-hydrolase [Kibdelosporangium phytohabitans]MBE1465282.1 cyclase [Kibdelosporangium phytohabitans]